LGYQPGGAVGPLTRAPYLRLRRMSVASGDPQLFLVEQAVDLVCLLGRQSGDPGPARAHVDRTARRRPDGPRKGPKHRVHELVQSDQPPGRQVVDDAFFAGLPPRCVGPRSTCAVSWAILVRALASGGTVRPLVEPVGLGRGGPGRSKPGPGAPVFLSTNAASRAVVLRRGGRCQLAPATRWIRVRNSARSSP
jgi:hypothetical protein